VGVCVWGGGCRCVCVCGCVGVGVGVGVRVRVWVGGWGVILCVRAVLPCGIGKHTSQVCCLNNVM
jgi:hypothetical protein